MMDDLEKLKITTDALLYIINNCGNVCPMFNLCSHIGCQNSYEAWITAKNALNKISDNTKDVTVNEQSTH